MDEEMKATAQTQAYASGFGGLLWNENVHKKAELKGLTIDNKYTAPQTIVLYDGFLTTASIVGATGAVQAAEDLGVSNALSGKIRLQLTVPAQEFVKLGEHECKAIEFLGKAYVIASADSANCIVIAQYSMS